MQILGCVTLEEGKPLLTWEAADFECNPFSTCILEFLGGDAFSSASVHSEQNIKKQCLCICVIYK